MQDLRSVPVISHKFLFDNVLPPVPSSVNLQMLKEDLRSGDVVRNNGWRGFETQPKNSQQTESDTFSPLVQVFNDIVESVVKDKTLSVVLKMNHSPNFAPLSRRANSSKPDGYLELVNRMSIDTDAEKTNWEDIPVSMEFKKSTSSKDTHDVRPTRLSRSILLIFDVRF